MDKKIRINMLVKGLDVKGQGVGSAAIEQMELVKTIDEFDVSINGKKNNSYDIRHIHTIHPDIRMKMNKKATNVMYVHFIPEMNDGSLHMPKLIFNIYRKYVLSMYKKADEVIVVNPYFIKDLINVGLDKEKISYIPNYVSKDRFFKLDDEKRKEARESFGFKDGEFIILGVGQTQTRKGIKDFYEIAKKNPTLTFVWAGGFTFKKMTDGYKEIKEMMGNPPSNLRFLGIIDRSRMNELYNACDVLFLPSYQELFPMTILECINTDTPFVVRDLDLYKDIFFTPYIVGHNNEEFEELLYKLKDDKEYFNKGSKYSIDIADFYSKENVKKLWKEYYTRIYQKYNKK